MSERGADFDAKREAYETARAKLAQLYDNPDKSVSVDTWRMQIRAAQAASNSAHAAMLAAHRG